MQKLHRVDLARRIVDEDGSRRRVGDRVAFGRRHDQDLRKTILETVRVDLYVLEFRVSGGQQDQLFPRESAEEFVDIGKGDRDRGRFVPGLHDRGGQARNEGAAFDILMFVAEFRESELRDHPLPGRQKLDRCDTVFERDPDLDLRPERGIDQRAVEIHELGVGKHNAPLKVLKGSLSRAGENNNY